MTIAMNDKTKISLKEIDNKNYKQCIELRTTKEQEKYVATNEYSIAQAYILEKYEKKAVFPLGIYANEEMIGFTLIVFHTNMEEVKIFEPIYEIVRFMLDEKFQSKGYGKIAFEEILKFIKTGQGGLAKYAVLSYVIGNDIAQKIYSQSGFVDTEFVFDDEKVMLLKL